MDSSPLHNYAVYPVLLVACRMLFSFLAAVSYFAIDFFELWDLVAFLPVFFLALLVRLLARRDSFDSDLVFGWDDDIKLVLIYDSAVAAVPQAAVSAGRASKPQHTADAAAN